jgi:mRNA interferase MazF
MVEPKIKRGKVVLVNFPFTDGFLTKVRPAVIITPDSLLPLMKDVLCIFISSSKLNQILPSDFVIDSNNPFFQQSGLRFNSTIRCHKIALIEKSLVNRVLGELDNSLIEAMNGYIKIAMGL